MSRENLSENVSEENVRSKNASVRYDENGIEQVQVGLEYVSTSSGTNGNVVAGVPGGSQRRSVSFASTPDDSMTSAGGTDNATDGSVGTMVHTEDTNEFDLNLSEGHFKDRSQNRNNKLLDSYRNMSKLLDDEEESGGDNGSDSGSESNNFPTATVTRSGRVSRAPR